MRWCFAESGSSAEVIPNEATNFAVSALAKLGLLTSTLLKQTKICIQFEQRPGGHPNHCMQCRLSSARENSEALSIADVIFNNTIYIFRILFKQISLEVYVV
jgi:hypothetical protein